MNFQTQLNTLILDTKNKHSHGNYNSNDLVREIVKADEEFPGITKDYIEETKDLKSIGLIWNKLKEHKQSIQLLDQATSGDFSNLSDQNLKGHIYCENNPTLIFQIYKKKLLHKIPHLLTVEAHVQPKWLRKWAHGTRRIN